MSESLQVKLPGAAYNIQWFHTFREIQREINRQLVTNTGNHIVITNTKIAVRYKKEISSMFSRARVITIADGENLKQVSTIESLCSKLVKLKADRSTTLWALGGGVIGDITGFLAAVYMRGIKFYQVPTTLLAMVDSSVGGKTGVNLPEGKNMVGSFYQPQGVLMALPFLNTLPNREYKCGLAEIIKSALIKNKSFFAYLKANEDLILKRDMDVCKQMSIESVKIKKWVVQKDEREQNLRAILNFGHTLAHSLEKHYRYQALNHGEAVSIGMSFATFLSYQKGYLKEAEWLDVYEFLGRLKMPRNLGDIKGAKKATIANLIAPMYADKKSKGQVIYFVLLDKIGKYRLPQEVKEAELKKHLKSFSKLK